MGCASSNKSVSPKVTIKLNNLENTKYFGSDIIWQDMPTNKTRKISRGLAEHYCKSLKLLGIDTWRLPSIDEIRHDLENKNILNYEYNIESYQSGMYHTSSEECYNSMSMKNGGAALTTIMFSPLLILGKVASSATSDNCQFQRNSKHNLKTRKSSSNAFIRCVVNVEEYKSHRNKELQIASSSRERKTYQGYLKAFKISHNIKDIKNAYTLASNIEENLNSERLMAKVLTKKVFTLYDGKDATSQAKKSGLDIGFTGSAISEKDFSKTFTLKSDFLQYGSYDVKVKFNFDITYDEQRLISSYTSREHKEKTLSFHLSPSNNYKQTKTVTFKDVTVGMAASTMSIKAISKEMKDNELSYEILGID